MTELKTLKDIETNVFEDLGNIVLKDNIIKSSSGRPFLLNRKMDRFFVLSDELRAEAIKWIKQLHMPYVKVENGELNSDVWDSDTKRLIRNAQASILIDFFNIKEEDLK